MPDKKPTAHRKQCFQNTSFEEVRRTNTHSSPTPMPSLTRTVQCCSQHALQKECWQGRASRVSRRTTCRHTPHWSDWGAWNTEITNMTSDTSYGATCKALKYWKTPKNQFDKTWWPTDLNFACRNCTATIEAKDKATILYYKLIDKSIKLHMMLYFHPKLSVAFTENYSFLCYFWIICCVVATRRQCVLRVALCELMFSSGCKKPPNISPNIEQEGPSLSFTPRCIWQFHPATCVRA